MEDFEYIRHGIDPWELVSLNEGTALACGTDDAAHAIEQVAAKRVRHHRALGGFASGELGFVHQHQQGLAVAQQLDRVRYNKAVEAKFGPFDFGCWFLLALTAAVAAFAWLMKNW